MGVILRAFTLCYILSILLSIAILHGLGCRMDFLQTFNLTTLLATSALGLYTHRSSCRCWDLPGSESPVETLRRVRKIGDPCDIVQSCFIVGLIENFHNVNVVDNSANLCIRVEPSISRPSAVERVTHRLCGFPS